MSNGEVLIDVSALKGKKIMLATPMYGGMGNAMFFSSVLRLQDQCLKRGIEMHHCFMSNESLIDRARNGLAHEFLNRSNADFLLFIDADIEFRPEDVFAMMSFDKDLICGPYPKKSINWPVVITAIENGEKDPAILSKLVGEYVFTPLDANPRMEQIIRVAEAGTGLMLIKRGLLEKMMKEFPDKKYISDHSADVLNGNRREMFAFFRTEIKDGRYLSEDYYFCHKWREIGGDVWLFPWALTAHYGTYGFQGSVGQLVDLMRKLENARSGS